MNINKREIQTGISKEEKYESKKNRGIGTGRSDGIFHTACRMRGRECFTDRRNRKKDIGFHREIFGGTEKDHSASPVQ